MAGRTIRPLSMQTWDAFEALATKHNGVWGGCWDAYFHPVREDRETNPGGAKDYKRRLVEAGLAHSALVFEDEVAIAWCQYGTPQEVPRIQKKKLVEVEGYEAPTFRVVCFFVDRDHRRTGVAGDALAGALGLIADAGGGVVEGYPHDTQGRKTSASFLYSATRSLFERAGFDFVRAVGKDRALMRTTVPPSPVS